ncbi:response regulator [Sulfitobacter albidus]|uniref:Response regulator n=1 Tax=Sulfitobacter albidus TaxID=2829501 RepID=A0A975PM74_9RHOB|nr:response regulator [Sulfitobacter albidus]QUJ76131.1 response regulator [Sulfitobacter albidus]
MMDIADTDLAPDPWFRALVVDDNPAFRALLCRQLARIGATVRDAGDASVFLSALHLTERPFDLAVIDIGLPGLQGDKIISWLRSSDDAHLRGLPIIVVSGGDTAGTEFAAAAPRVLFLQKPFRQERLVAAVNQLLRGGLAH